MALLHAGSPSPAGSLPKEIAMAWHSATAFTRARLTSADPGAEASPRRHVPAHRSGRLSLGRRAPGAHRRRQDTGAVARLFGSRAL